MIILSWRHSPSLSSSNKFKISKLVMNFSIFVFLAPFLICVEAQTTPDVRLPPYIINNPISSMIYKAGVERIVLNCSAGGTPTPTYQWFKDGKFYDKFPAESKTGELILTLPQASDAGVYQCYATNKWATTMSTSANLVVATFSDYPADASTGNYNAAVGQPYYLPCNSPESFPQATYAWAVAICGDNNVIYGITPNERQQIDPVKGDLHFANLQTSDQLLPGQCYKCGVTNRIIDVIKGGAYATLAISSVSVGNQAPKMAYQSLSPQVGILGGSVTLSCYFSGNPTPANPTWSKVGGSWPPTSRIEYGPFKTLLTINNLEQADGGDYKCETSNSVGNSAITITLNIQSTPKFNIPPTHINASNGDTVSFRCEVAGIPQPDIVWYRSGLPLSTSSLPNKYSLSTNTSVLTIRDVCKDCSDGSSDLTVIQCSSTNTHGRALASGYLNVLERTKVIEGPSSLPHPPSGEKFTLPCQAVSDPSTKVSIIWYFDEQRIFNDSGKWIVEESGNLTVLASAPNGNYTCVASNGVSTAYSSIWIGTQMVQASSSMWWLILLAVIILLLCLIILICFYIRNNKGQDYKVGEKERLNGNDPEKELRDTGFKEHYRGESTGSTANLIPEGYTTMTRSTPTTPQTLRKTGFDSGEGTTGGTTGGSIMSSIPPAGSEDGGSLNDYLAKDNVGKFNDEGSFIRSQIPE